MIYIPTKKRITGLLNRFATWDEISLVKSEWVIPADRMKAKREHRVPLSVAALEILKAIPQTGNEIFPTAKGKAMSDMTLAAVHKRMGLDATVHGWRSTFKDWTAERTSTPREVSEAALAHGHLMCIQPEPIQQILWMSRVPMQQANSYIPPIPRGVINT